jgi:hypothetical protein
MEWLTHENRNYQAQSVQVVVALLAFGLLVGASGSAAAAVRIEDKSGDGSPLANSTVTLWQASAPHDASKALHISFRCAPQSEAG